MPSPRHKLFLLGAVVVVLLGAVLAHAGSAAAVARVLLATGALAGLGWWTYRRPSGTARFALPPRLAVASRVALSAKCSLALVEADGQSYLIAFGDGFAEVKPARTRRLASPASPSPEHVELPGRAQKVGAA